MIRFFNTLSRKKEAFEPAPGATVGIYTCGPTVYDYAHIGNFRAYVFEDLLHRFLEYAGYTVKRVMNITDIDDKTIKGANKEGIPLTGYTERYTQAFFKDMESLRLKSEKDGIIFPRATGHIPEMVSLIKKLLEKGHAYEKEGSVYFRISTFPGYGKLSRLDFTEMKTAERIESDEYDKEEARDFALWKAEKENEVSWQTEIGKGRPGWHIECSAMSMKYLGETFDIHTGGIDNIFPHHENEIAQSEAATGKPFVKYWLHCNHLLVNGEKMSKSKGNFYTLRDLLEKGYNPVAIRYLLMTTHYRDPLNFTEDSLKQAENTVKNYRDFYQRLLHHLPKQETGESVSWRQVIDNSQQKFDDNLADDLNISGAMGAVFEAIKQTNIHSDEERGLSDQEIETMKGFLEKVDGILAILAIQQTVHDSVIEQKIRERNEARKNRDYAKADAIRKELDAKGIILEDTANGTRWIRK